ncbi:hypothetical protein Taro_027409, partial [Colocasia esculenta]|nr:hypothetical protein [Colocasia esculenta]
MLSQNTFWAVLGQQVDTGSGCVDTSGFPRTPSGLFWDSRSTRAQAVSTRVAFPEQNTWSGWPYHASKQDCTSTFKSSCVNMRSSSVDTRDSFQKTFWKTWDSVSTQEGAVSTLDGLPRTFWVKLGQCVDTRCGCVDTRCFPRTLSGLFWDSRSTRAQAVDTGTGCVDTGGFPRTKHM